MFGYIAFILVLCAQLVHSYPPIKHVYLLKDGNYAIGGPPTTPTTPATSTMPTAESNMLSYGDKVHLEGRAENTAEQNSNSKADNNANQENKIYQTITMNSDALYVFAGPVIIIAIAYTFYTLYTTFNNPTNRELRRIQHAAAAQNIDKETKF